MATTTSIPTKFGECLTNKEVDLDTDALKCSLHTSAYTYNQDSHKYWDVSVTNEVSGTGYTAGGVSLGTVTMSSDAASNQTRFDCADITFGTATVSTARQAVIYDSTPTSNKPIVCVINFGVDKDLSSGGLQIVVDVAGFFATQVA